jgi:hypothetical protein
LHPWISCWLSMRTQATKRVSLAVAWHPHRHSVDLVVVVKNVDNRRSRQCGRGIISACSTKMDTSTIILGIVVISRRHKQHDILGWCSIVFVGIKKLGRIQLDESQIRFSSLVHLHQLMVVRFQLDMMLSRNPSRLSRTEDSSVNLQTRESKPKHILESVLLDEAHEWISSQRLCLNVPR